MWLVREEENRVVFLLFRATWKLREWFALLFALLVVPILTHTCWVHTFSCLSRERTAHYMIMLIPTVFLHYTLVSNCYLVTIFFIRIIREKFEFTLYAHSWLFTNIIVLCRLGSTHVVFLSYYYRQRTELKWNIYMIRPFLNKNWCEFQNVYICPCWAVDWVQWDLGIRRPSWKWLKMASLKVGLTWYVTTLRKDFVILQFYWWLFSSTKHCSWNMV